MRNWRNFLPKKGNSIGKTNIFINIFKRKPDTWEEYEADVARRMEKSLGKAMELGANTAQEEVTGITVNWTLQNPEAQKYLRQHSLKLAKGINATTQRKVKSALLTGVDLGEGE